MERIIESIRDLASGSLSKDGYKILVSYVGHLIEKYSWPVTLIDEEDQHFGKWNTEKKVIFFHQCIDSFYSRNKLKYLDKIPDAYLRYYYTQIIVSFVSEQISKVQNKKGISYETVKRICREILNECQFKYIKGKKLFWFNENEFNGIIDTETGFIDIKIQNLLKIPLDKNTKQIKPLIKNALNEIFSAAGQPLEEVFLIHTLYQLFDQESFYPNSFEEVKNEINESTIARAVNTFIISIDETDKSVLKAYFFTDEQKTFTELAKQLKMPKSTVHFRVTSIMQKIRHAFTPENEEEGIEFLKIIHRKLDEI